LKTRDLSFVDLNRLQGISRIIDMTYNSGHCKGFLAGLKTVLGSFSQGFGSIAAYWEEHDLFRYPLQRRDVFLQLWNFVRASFGAGDRSLLSELLARDYARCERIVPDRAPAFFDTSLTREQRSAVGELVREETLRVRGQGIKIQYFAAIFRCLPELAKETVLVFVYRTGSGRRMDVTEVILPEEG
jgi:anaerobic magnesium-protoporphyrin IX monomethyl ester cyclase